MRVRKFTQFINENKLESGDIIEMLSDYDYNHKLSLISGERYRVGKNVKAENEYNLKNWWTIEGKYLNKDDNSIQPYGLTFTSKEFNNVIKLSKKVN
jgi:hypothetical protein